MSSEGYYLIEVERDATTGTDTKYNALDVSFDSIAVTTALAGWTILSKSSYHWPVLVLRGRRRLEHLKPHW